MSLLPFVVCLTFCASVVLANDADSTEKKSAKGVNPPQLVFPKLDSTNFCSPNFYNQFEIKSPDILGVFPNPEVDAKILKYMPWLDKRDVLEKRWDRYKPRLILQVGDSEKDVDQKQLQEKKE